MTPPTVDELAAWLSTAADDDQLQVALDAACAWTRRRRFRAEEDSLWEDEGVVLGTLIRAGLLWQRRAAPQGYDGYEDAAAVNGYTIYDARELVGVDVTV